MKKSLVVATIFAAAGVSAFANTIAASNTALVPLPLATFGGTGIDNQHVEVKVVTVTSQTSANQDVITMGLTATARYSNPQTGNNGFGTFHATTGFNNGLDGASPAHDLGPTWDFNGYINVSGNLGGTYSFVLDYANNLTGVDQKLALGSLTSGQTAQDSWNLSMGFLSGIGYDPYAAGNWGISLQEVNSDGVVLNSTAIVVKVASVPDTSSTLMLMGAGLVGIVAFGYKQNRFVFAK